MPPSLMRLFKRDVCLKNQQFVFQSSFSQLIDILIKPIALLCAGVCVCACVYVLYVCLWVITEC